MFDIKNAFEALGYRCLMEKPESATNDIWYCSKLSTADVTHVAFLEYKRSQKAYAIWVGVSNPHAMRRLQNALPTIRKYVRPEIVGSTFNITAQPCWTLFNAGRALKWKPLLPPEAIDRGVWQARLHELVDEFLKPILWTIKTPLAVRDLLLRNEKPFEWSIGFPVLRAAEVIALTKSAESDCNSIRDQLFHVEGAISAGIHGFAGYEKMVEDFIEHL